MTDTDSFPRLRLGTAPDSWGVWFPEDANQVPWNVFLDEAATAGYEWVELGPYGYLPTDPARLQDELGSRGLRLSGGAVFSGLHRGTDALAQAFEDCRVEARLLTALGARYLVSLPEGYTDLDGVVVGPAELTDDEWDALTSGMSTLARMLHQEFDVDLVFHPHADSHVDTQPHVVRFLEGTDPEVVNLCLDTGHISYCGGDNLEIIRAYPERIGYVHLKQVDPTVMKQVEQERLGFAPACRLGVMTEPPDGIPAMEPLLAELAALDVPLFAIVEQDMYPCPPDRPAPIATRTRRYFNACGLGPIRA
jgi:inosose dehydratase